MNQLIDNLAWLCPPHGQMTKPWETENAAFLTTKLYMQYQQLTVLPKIKFPSFYKNKICAFFSWLFHMTYMEWNQCNILSLNYCKEASARATLWEIRSCIGSCMKKAKLWFYLWQIFLKKCSYLWHITIIIYVIHLPPSMASRILILLLSRTRKCICQHKVFPT